MRSLRVLIGMLVLVALLALVLTSCPSNRDGMPGQLAAAKEESQSAARSGALALQLWAQHRSTRDLTCVQLADARDEIVKAYGGIATLKAEDPADLGRQQFRRAGRGAPSGFVRRTTRFSPRPWWRGSTASTPAQARHS